MVAKHDLERQRPQIFARVNAFEFVPPLAVVEAVDPGAVEIVAQGDDEVDPPMALRHRFHPYRRATRHCCREPLPWSPSTRNSSRGLSSGAGGMTSVGVFRARSATRVAAKDTSYQPAEADPQGAQAGAAGAVESF